MYITCITQKQIVEELETVFADDWYRPCTVEDANQLKYLECCIKESLRLYPSAPIVGRSSTTPIEIGEILFSVGKLMNGKLHSEAFQCDVPLESAKQLEIVKI